MYSLPTNFPLYMQCGCLWSVPNFRNLRISLIILNWVILCAFILRILKYDSLGCEFYFIFVKLLTETDVCTVH